MHKLKPECAFVQADVPSCRLRTTFDARLVEDTISQTNRLEDFKAALRTAHALWWRADPLRRLRGQGKLASASQAEVKLAPRASGRRDPGSAP
ncbi:MAG: hypothetical protein RLZ83_1993 [Pseudomonadota bacterium]